MSKRHCTGKDAGMPHFSADVPCRKILSFFQIASSAYSRIIPHFLQTLPLEIRHKERKTMKATGIVRRVDDLGRIVIPKEIRRTLRIREGDPLLTTLAARERFACAVGNLESNTFS